MRVRTDDLHLTTVDDTTVVLDTSTSAYLTLNAAGGFLLAQLQAETTAEALVAALVERYGIPTETATADVVAFLGQLRARDLLLG